MACSFLGVDEAVVEKVEFDEDSRAVVGHVRLVRATRGRCGICRCRCSGYDAGEGRRRWRTLDLGSRPAYIEADAPRVSCPKHGVVVAHVPWARHGAGHTIAFDETVAWLATQCSKTAVGSAARIGDI
jgi:transposase